MMLRRKNVNVNVFRLTQIKYRKKTEIEEITVRDKVQVRARDKTKVKASKDKVAHRKVDKAHRDNVLHTRAEMPVAHHEVQEIMLVVRVITGSRLAARKTKRQWMRKKSRSK